VSNSGRTDKFRILKRWRTLAGLNFPIFDLELAVLQALKGMRLGDVVNTVSATLAREEPSPRLT